MKAEEKKKIYSKAIETIYETIGYLSCLDEQDATHRLTKIMGELQEKDISLLKEIKIPHQAKFRD